MWALQNYTDWRTTKQNAMEKHFCGISCFLNNVFGTVSVSTKEGDAIIKNIWKDRLPLQVDFRNQAWKLRCQFKNGWGKALVKLQQDRSGAVIINGHTVVLMGNVTLSCESVSKFCAFYIQTIPWIKPLLTIPTLTNHHYGPNHHSLLLDLYNNVERSPALTLTTTRIPILLTAVWII